MPSPSGTNYKISWVHPATGERLEVYSPKKEWAIHVVNVLADAGHEQIEMELL